MNIKREIIALGIRILNEKTNIVPQADPFSELITVIFGGETRDQRLARVTEENLDRATAAAKSAIVNHKFKQITKNI